jgi:FkbM family methyltransferase
LKLRARGLLNQLLRGRLIAAYRLFRPRVTDDVSGSRITYEPGTDIGRALFFNGEFERRELDLCRKYVSRDSVILDLGANIGLHSIYFANLAPDGFVLAVEPSLDTFDLLRRNVSGKANIAPLNVAISDKGGVLDFFHASDNAYSSLRDTKRSLIAKTTKVPCMTIDDVAEALRLERVDLVKIDVEGFEYNVLKGMKNVISKFRPIIFCEIYQGIGSNEAPDETVRLLLDQNYRAFVFHDGEMIEYERHDDDFYNYLFLPENGEHP